MGIHDISNENKFVYDSTDEPIVFADWIPGEPSNDGGKGDCVAYWKHDQDIGWNDLPCDHKTSVVCEGHGNNKFEELERLIWITSSKSNDQVFKIDNKVYTFSSKVASFDSAQEHCAQFGGKLFEPRTRDIYKDVKVNLKALGSHEW